MNIDGILDERALKSSSLIRLPGIREAIPHFDAIGAGRPGPMPWIPGRPLWSQSHLIPFRVPKGPDVSIQQIPWPLVSETASARRGSKETPYLTNEPFGATILNLPTSRHPESSALPHRHSVSSGFPPPVRLEAPISHKLVQLKKTMYKTLYTAHPADVMSDPGQSCRPAYHVSREKEPAAGPAHPESSIRATLCYVMLCDASQPTFVDDHDGITGEISECRPASPRGSVVDQIIRLEHQPSAPPSLSPAPSPPSDQSVLNYDGLSLKTGQIGPVRTSKGDSRFEPYSTTQPDAASSVGPSKGSSIETSQRHSRRPTEVIASTPTSSQPTNLGPREANCRIKSHLASLPPRRALAAALVYFFRKVVYQDALACVADEKSVREIFSHSSLGNPYGKDTSKCDGDCRYARRMALLLGVLYLGYRALHCLETKTESNSDVPEDHSRYCDRLFDAFKTAFSCIEYDRSRDLMAWQAAVLYGAAYVQQSRAAWESFQPALKTAILKWDSLLAARKIRENAGEEIRRRIAFGLVLLDNFNAPCQRTFEPSSVLVISKDPPSECHLIGDDCVASSTDFEYPNATEASLIRAAMSLSMCDPHAQQGSDDRLDNTSFMWIRDHRQYLVEFIEAILDALKTLPPCIDTGALKKRVDRILYLVTHLLCLPVGIRALKAVPWLSLLMIQDKMLPTIES
ncbi:hypothetical protein SISNIDRAFT_459115 [Sistotremastrum niveocremeum HHB9708]|uniref:Transcription factor domain-containing protein n=2 Tax=Sistotremastraceae TaxID=3402574 RepID=A0A164PXV8_9AGAM|nr:hypothetical protein SISNIDRAFT_459115 [Sistotremastrum niveocremeum HHB9708]KZT34040.1 hypothetical protein SISSUDRAFT_1053410 [Sistotremastrum suecicum HHB10207 ss-3]